MASKCIDLWRKLPIFYSLFYRVDLTTTKQKESLRYSSDCDVYMYGVCALQAIYQAFLQSTPTDN